MGSIKAPAGLAAGGKRVWASITGKYELRPDELATLEDACRISDMIDALTSVWMEAGAPSITRGSMGQEVIHPLIGEIRTQRMARNRLFAQMKLPQDGSAGAAEPNQHRSAANSRWAAAYGKGA